MNYVKESKEVDFYRLNGLLKSIKHYGGKQFWKVIDSLPDRDLFAQVYQMALDGSCEVVKIIRKENQSYITVD